MKEFFYSTIGSYITIGFINILVYVFVFFLRRGKNKIEQGVAEFLPYQESIKVNDILDVLEKLTDAAVQDANIRMVQGLKDKNIFTPEVAAAVKNTVIQDVINNLGPLKSQAVGLLGSLESIIGNLIEKYVANTKKAG